MSSNSFSRVLILFLNRAICADEGEGGDDVAAEEGEENVEARGEGGDEAGDGSNST